MSGRCRQHRWSASIRDRSGARARVYERYAGSCLQVSVWVPPDGLKRSSLGHKDRERARQEARALLALRSVHVREADGVTLGQVLHAYLEQLKHHDDGTAKTPRYLADCKRRSAMLCSSFGAETLAESVRPKRVREYARDRRAGVIGGRPVRTESIRADLVFLKAALRWATTYDSSDKEPMLMKSPLDGFEVPKEKSPRRPLLTDEEVSALRKVAPRIHAYFPLVFLLAASTGRRISSILGLLWSDVDFRKRTITWRAALDKPRRGWVTPIPAMVLPALKRYRRVRSTVGSALLFPSSRDELRPVSRHTAADWLKRAFRAANVPKPEGSLWHCLRRKWGTERKGSPLPDVLAAGGWNSPETYYRCYATATIDGMRSVVDLPKGRA